MHKNPETVVDAVTATMQTKCILASLRIAAASHNKEETISAVFWDDKLLDLVTKLSDKIDIISIQPRYSSRPRPIQQFRLLDRVTPLLHSLVDRLFVTIVIKRGILPKGVLLLVKHLGRETSNLQLCEGSPGWG